MTAVSLVLALMAGTCEDAHLANNSVYRSLLEEGVGAAKVGPFPLPRPVMPDGLTREQQQQVLTDLLGNLSLERFLRESVVAPHICRVEDVRKDKDTAVRRIDVYFVAFADLAKLSSDEVVLGNSAEDEKAKSRELTDDELSSRSLARAKVDGTTVIADGYGYSEFVLLNRVKLNATGRGTGTRTADSIVAAGMVDPRFANDKDYANRWRGLSRAEDGTLQVGPAQTYEGAGAYFKATRLEQPEGSLFVEGHILFVEPVGWFAGRNQLRAKLPAIVQSQVRSARREMLRATQR